MTNRTVEPTGSETQVLGTLGTGQDLTAVFRERITEGPDDVLHINPNTALVHLFDKDTGQRLN